MSTEPQPPEDDLLPAFGWLVLGAIVTFFIAANLPWSLDDPREVDSAFVAHRMIAEQRWLVPHPAEGLAHPPLHAWLSAACYAASLQHGWDLAWRLPALAASLGLLVLLWRQGERLFGNNTGSVLAVSAFGLNFVVPRLATAIGNEMLLAFCAGLAGVQILEKLRARRGWSAREHLNWALLLCAAVYAGGAAVFASLFPGLIAVSLLRRRWILGTRQWWCWLWLIPVALYVSGAIWVSRAEGKWPAFAAADGISAAEASVDFLARMLPWSLLAVLLLSVKPVRREIAQRPALAWLAWWSAGALAVGALRHGEAGASFAAAIPPLCLFLAGAAHYLPRFRLYGQPVGRFAVLAPLLMAPLTAAVVMSRVSEAFTLERRQAAGFGKELATVSRPESRALSVVSGVGRRSLIQAGAPGFTAIDEALERWREGRLEWLAIDTDTLARYRAELAPFTLVATSPPDRAAPQGCNLLHAVPIARGPRTLVKTAGLSPEPTRQLPPPEFR